MVSFFWGFPSLFQWCLLPVMPGFGVRLPCLALLPKCTEDTVGRTKFFLTYSWLLLHPESLLCLAALASPSPKSALYNTLQCLSFWPLPLTHILWPKSCLCPESQLRLTGDHRYFVAAFRWLSLFVSGTYYFMRSKTRRWCGVEGDWSKGAAGRHWGGRDRRREEAGLGRLRNKLLVMRELWKAPVWGLTREQSKDCSPKFIGLIY